MLNDIIYYENRGAKMDFIVVFFRDVLDGPLYVAVAIINSLLICSCIGYLADNYLKVKESKEKYYNTFVTPDNVNSQGQTTSIQDVTANNNQNQ